MENDFGTISAVNFVMISFWVHEVSDILLN